MTIFKMFRNGKRPLALLATRSPDALAGVPPDEFQVREAVSTLGVIHALEQSPALVVVDADDLVECPQISRPTLQAAIESLREQGAVVVTAREFLGEPQRWIGEALMASGARSGIRYMPTRIVLVTNFCGGVGKTTLSLALARRFRAASGLAAALIELGVGGSSLDARIGPHTSLYNFVTQKAEIQSWEKVSIFTSDSWAAEVLAKDERAPAVLKSIAHDHTLTVLDTFPPNPLWKWAIELATDIVVVTAPRPDSIAQTDAILRRLTEETNALDPKPRIHLVMNQVRTLGERLAMTGQLSAWIGFDERRAERLDGSLADPILSLLYPGWERRKPHKNGKEKLA